MRKAIFAVVLMCVLMTATFAQRQQVASQQGAAVKQLPFYFPPGVIQTTDVIKQQAEYARYAMATNQCFHNATPFPLSSIVDPDSIRIKTDIDSTSSVTDSRAKMEIVLDHFVRVGDKIRVTTLCDQKLITEEELKVVVDDILSIVPAAAYGIDFDYYKSVTDDAIRARAGKLGLTEDEFRKQLDEKDPNYDITFREINRIPAAMRRSDFVPRELHLGYNPQFLGALGVTWLNTGVVYYNPQARVLDYLIGKPVVLAHEFIHANVNLQKFPLSDGFDTELFASIPDMLLPEDQMNFFFHPYPEDIRELAWIYFGFNFKQVQKEIVRFDFGGPVWVDEVKYRQYFKELERIKAEMLSFFRDVVIPEFYSDPLWWSAMNDRRGDRNSVFRIMMANHFDPTILGGHAETMKWLLPRTDVAIEMARKAHEASSQDAGNNFGMMSQIPQFLIDRYRAAFSEKEQQTIREHFLSNPDAAVDIQKMNMQELLKFFERFKIKPRGGVR